jgi:hypothetical protein
MKLAPLLLIVAGCTAQAERLPSSLSRSGRDVLRGELAFQLADHHKPPRPLYTLRLRDAGPIVVYLELLGEASSDAESLIGQQIEAVGIVRWDGRHKDYLMDVESIRATGATP